MSQYAPGAAISPFVKGGISRVPALESLLSVASSAQLIRHMHGHFHQRDHDIIGALYDDVLMMQMISADDT